MSAMFKLLTGATIQTMTIGKTKAGKDEGFPYLSVNFSGAAKTVDVLPLFAASKLTENQLHKTFWDGEHRNLTALKHVDLGLLTIEPCITELGARGEMRHRHIETRFQKCRLKYGELGNWELVFQVYFPDPDNQLFDWVKDNLQRPVNLKVEQREIPISEGGSDDE